MRYYVVDAFTNTVFKGNPAGVCLLESWPDDAVLQNIAAENNLSETAFILPDGNGYQLRWFTPAVEIDLCGHATLASAYVLTTIIRPELSSVSFHTKSGILTVAKRGDLFFMDFPTRAPVPAAIPPGLEDALGVRPLAAYAARDFLVLLENEKVIADLRPDFQKLKTLEGGFGIIVTAQSEPFDFVSRFFAPNAGIDEDPVTGSSHCTLIPFWSQRLGKKSMLAGQLSRRGGTLYCEDRGERVGIGGNAVLYSAGEIRIK